MNKGMKRKLLISEPEGVNTQNKIPRKGKENSVETKTSKGNAKSTLYKADTHTKQSAKSKLKRKTKWKAKHGTIYISSSGKPTKSQTSTVEQTDNSTGTGFGKTISTKRKGGSCMKHKRKDKQHLEPEKMEETVSNKVQGKGPIHLPKSAAEISVNWKQLIKSDKSLRRKHHKKLHREKHHREQMKTESKEPKVESAPDIWFDDVDEVLIETLRCESSSSQIKARPSRKEKTSDASTEEKTEKVNPLVKPQSYGGLTKVLAMDCEMVGVGDGGKDSILARVSLVNQYGQCVYDKHVKPTERVTDYRTHVSGIRRKDIEKGEKFSDVQEEVSDMLKDRILVGHALQNDFKVLFLSHPKKKLRDTVRYRPFLALFNGRRPSLKKLTEKVLGVAVQEGEHDSVQDAQAAMRLYTMYRKQWEKEIKDKCKKVWKAKP